MREFYANSNDDSSITICVLSNFSGDDSLALCRTDAYEMNSLVLCADWLVNRKYDKKYYRLFLLKK